MPTRAAEISGTDGEYRERDASSPPECRTPKGCPKGTPEKSKALSSSNQLAYQHYLECKATGQWPDDAIVRRNAAVIREVEDYAERLQKRLEFEQMKQLLILEQAGKGIGRR